MRRGVSKIGPAGRRPWRRASSERLVARLGLPIEQRDGLRVTTPEIAQLVEMVPGGR